MIKQAITEFDKVVFQTTLFVTGHYLTYFHVLPSSADAHPYTKRQFIILARDLYASQLKTIQGVVSRYALYRSHGVQKARFFSH
ncbi:hypothetical protein ACFQGA_17510 [Marinobacter koreensis]|uniref:hypothetical protein n=1 Tax=Marinobacter koreensis TaxID=335974 RepID=UPI00361DE394